MDLSVTLLWMRHVMVTLMTKAEKNWVLYDVGNSAFVLLVSTIMPIYFNYLAEKAGLSSVDYLAYWGYAASVATIIVAVMGPVFGTLADTKGFKKPIFTATLMIGAIALFFIMGIIVFKMAVHKERPVLLEMLAK